RRDGRALGRVRQRPRLSALGSDRRRLARRDPATHTDDPGARDPRPRRGPRRGAGEDGVLERVQGARPLVGRAASILGRRRAAALGVLLVGLVAYGAVAGHLPELPSGVDVAFLAAVVFPAFAAAIWLALPLAQLRTVPLLVMALVAGSVA